MGAAILLADGGFEELMTRMKNMAFPHAAAEAKELYKSGHKVKGVLSRQPSESMVNYVA